MNEKHFGFLWLGLALLNFVMIISFNNVINYIAFLGSLLVSGYYFGAYYKTKKSINKMVLIVVSDKLNIPIETLNDMSQKEFHELLLKNNLNIEWIANQIVEKRLIG